MKRTLSSIQSPIERFNLEVCKFVYLIFWLTNTNYNQQGGKVVIYLSNKFTPVNNITVYITQLIHLDFIIIDSGYSKLQ